MTGIVKILCLLPILYTDYEEVKLITKLNNFFKFDHNIYILHASSESTRFINGQNTPKSVFVFDVEDNVTGLEELTKIKSKNTLVLVVPGSSKYEENVQFLSKLQQIQRLQINLKIGMFFMHAPSNEDLKNIFTWCKKSLVVNVFVATYIQGLRDERSLNIFTFNPFGPFGVINVTGRSDVTYERFFPSLKLNFQRHTLLTLHLKYVATFNIRMWNEVFRKMNATIRLVNSNSLTTEPLKQGIDVLPGAYRLNDLCNVSVSCNVFSEIYMYPSIIEPVALIVPEALPYSEFAAYLQTIASDKFFGYSLFTTVAIMLLLSVVRYIEQKKILFFQSVPDVLNLIANDNGYIKYQRLSRVEVFLIVLITFMGFIFVNGILSNLQSYLTRPVLQPQINTAEDLYRYPINISTYLESVRDGIIEVLTDNTKYKDWGDRVVIMDPTKLMGQVRYINRSYSTLLQQTDIIMLLELQKHLNIKGYYKLEIGLPHTILAYFVHHTFLYFERANDIINRVQSAGLLNLWRRVDLAWKVKTLLRENIANIKKQKERNVENATLPISVFIFYGWVVGVIVLIIEIPHFV